MGIRKLDWQEIYQHRDDGSHEVIGWEADSGFDAHYGVDQYFGSDSFGFEVFFDYQHLGDVDDPDQAKQIAQDDFERRINAALTQD